MIGNGIKVKICISEESFGSVSTIQITQSNIKTLSN